MRPGSPRLVADRLRRGRACVGATATPRARGAPARRRSAHRRWQIGCPGSSHRSPSRASARPGPRPRPSAPHRRSRPARGGADDRPSTAAAAPAARADRWPRSARGAGPQAAHPCAPPHVASRHRTIGDERTVARPARHRPDGMNAGAARPADGWLHEPTCASQCGRTELGLVRRWSVRWVWIQVPRVPATAAIASAESGTTSRWAIRVGDVCPAPDRRDRGCPGVQVGEVLRPQQETHAAGCGQPTSRAWCAHRPKR